MHHPWLIVRARRLPLSFRVARGVPWIIAAIALLTFAVMVLNMGIGSYPIAPLDVLRSLVLPGANPEYDLVVRTLRLPRMLVGLCVGAALGVSGAIIQGLARNPLADPDLLGISPGASLAAISLIVFGGQLPAGALPFFAFAGASVAAALIYILSWSRGDSPIRMVLIGIGIGSVITAFMSMVLTMGQVYEVQRALVWLAGSINGRVWKDFWPLLPWVTLGIPAALLASRHLDTLALGEDVARGLGSPVARQRGLLLLIAVALASSTVAAAGTIGFVGLMAPHIARRLVGPGAGAALPTAALVGGLIVVLSDLIGRSLFAPLEIPCGLITAIIGAPFFLSLLVRRRRR